MSWKSLRLDKLEAENVKLREQGERLFDKTLELATENDKLRKLVTRMARALSVGGDWCVRECYAEFRCTGSCAIADALVELGIAEYEEEDE